MSGVLMTLNAPLRPTTLWSLGWMACIGAGLWLIDVWSIGPIRDALREYDERICSGK